MTGYKLISSDSHVSIPAEAWAEYLAPEFRDEAPTVEVTDEGEFEVFQGTRTLRKPNLSNAAGYKPEEFAFSTNIRKLEKGRPGAWDPEERIKDQDIDGVLAEVLYFGGPLRQAQNNGLRLDSFRAYNRWLADFCSHSPKRLVGVAAIPCDDPELALAGLNEASKMGLRAAAIDVFPPKGHTYSAPEWRPLFERFSELNIPVSLHVGGDRGHIGVRPGTQFMTMMVANKLGMADAICELIFAGILQDLPELKVVSVEAQIGWISFVHYYADHVYDKQRFWTGCELTEHPSFYWKRQVYATFMEDPVGLREREHIGVDNIMWANDYPHSETTWPNSKSLTDEWFSNYSDEDKAKILWQNAARVHNIEV